MRRDLPRIVLVGTEDAADHRQQARGIHRCARTARLAPNAPAADQIDAVVTLESGNRVHEGKRLDGEPQSSELVAKSLEPPELVAQRGRTLELEPLACALHITAQEVDRPVVRTVEERARE